MACMDISGLYSRSWREGSPPRRLATTQLQSRSHSVPGDTISGRLLCDSVRVVQSLTGGHRRGVLAETTASDTERFSAGPPARPALARNCRGLRCPRDAAGDHVRSSRRVLSVRRPAPAVSAEGRTIRRDRRAAACRRHALRRADGLQTSPLLVVCQRRSVDLRGLGRSLFSRAELVACDLRRLTLAELALGRNALESGRSLRQAPGPDPGHSVRTECAGLERRRTVALSVGLCGCHSV